jgi:hypothetical protein
MTLKQAAARRATANAAFEAAVVKKKVCIAP